MVASTRLSTHLLVALLGVAALHAQPVQEMQPHIIVLLADDLGFADVGFRGSEIATPHIDELARRGVLVNQFYVQPVCSPTRAALLTGRYPMRLGLQCGVVRPWATHGLPLEERTLPRALREAGYETAISGKWHLGHVAREYLPTQRGFDHQYGHYNGALDYFTHERDGGHDWHRDDRANRDEGYTTHLIAREAVRRIEERDESKPLFLYVPFNAPHTPLQVPTTYLERYEPMKNVKRRKYAAMVACLDEAIGTILAAVAKHLPGEKTLIVFLSDNGGIASLGSNGHLRAGKGRLYEGGVRVPAVFVWAGQLTPGHQIDEPLHVVDLYPTLLQLTGAQHGSGKPLDGSNVWSVLRGEAPSPHEEILLNVNPFCGALRSGRYKIVHNGHVGANAFEVPEHEAWELYDLLEDPSEERDLRSERPEVFERLKARLTQYAAVAAPANILTNDPPEGFHVPEVWGGQ